MSTSTIFVLSVIVTTWPVFSSLCMRFSKRIYHLIVLVCMNLVFYLKTSIIIALNFIPDYLRHTISSYTRVFLQNMKTGRDRSQRQLLTTSICPGTGIFKSTTHSAGIHSIDLFETNRITMTSSWHFVFLWSLIVKLIF